MSEKEKDEALQKQAAELWNKLDSKKRADLVMGVLLIGVPEAELLNAEVDPEHQALERAGEEFHELPGFLQDALKRAVTEDGFLEELSFEEWGHRTH